MCKSSEAGLRAGGTEGIPVANGAAHGAGIYAAKMRNMGLAFHFAACHSRAVFLCLLMNDAEPLEQPYQLGELPVTAESDNVRLSFALTVWPLACEEEAGSAFVLPRDSAFRLVLVKLAAANFCKQL